MTIDVNKELEEAQAKLPIALPDGPLSIDIQIRTIAVTVAARFVGETCVKEGALYQQLKMDNKLGDHVNVNHVIRAALVFERYMWGEWSKGIAEHTLEQISTEAADAVEAAYQEKLRDRGIELDAEFKDESPTAPHGGGE